MRIFESGGGQINWWSDLWWCVRLIRSGHRELDGVRLKLNSELASGLSKTLILLSLFYLQFQIQCI